MAWHTLCLYLQLLYSSTEDQMPQKTICGLVVSCWRTCSGLEVIDHNGGLWSQVLGNESHSFQFEWAVSKMKLGNYRLYFSFHSYFFGLCPALEQALFKGILLSYVRKETDFPSPTSIKHSMLQMPKSPYNLLATSWWNLDFQRSSFILDQNYNKQKYESKD